MTRRHGSPQEKDSLPFCSPEALAPSREPRRPRACKGFRSHRERRRSQRPFLKNDRRKGTKRFAKLDLLIHRRLHGRASRIAENTAAPEGPRSKLHPPLEPPHHPLIGNQFSDLVAEGGFVGERAEDGSQRAQFRSISSSLKANPRKEPCWVSRGSTWRGFSRAGAEKSGAPRAPPASPAAG